MHVREGGGGKGEREKVAQTNIKKKINDVTVSILTIVFYVDSGS